MDNLEISLVRRIERELLALKNECPSDRKPLILYEQEILLEIALLKQKLIEQQKKSVCQVSLQD